MLLAIKLHQITRSTSVEVAGCSAVRRGQIPLPPPHAEPNRPVPLIGSISHRPVVVAAVAVAGRAGRAGKQRRQVSGCARTGPGGRDSYLIGGWCLPSRVSNSTVPSATRGRDRSDASVPAEIWDQAGKQARTHTAALGWSLATGAGLEQRGHTAHSWREMAPLAPCSMLMCPLKCVHVRRTVFRGEIGPLSSM